MRSKILIGIGVVAVMITAFLLFRRNTAGSEVDIFSSVKRGAFRIEIETTGELEAKSSVKILGPSQLRDFRIWNVAIQDIVDEGTQVKKGDWVASLDRSEFQNRYNEKQIELEKERAAYVQTQLDTTLQLRQARDELINLKYAVDEKAIILEQSIYEPPATIKQAQINLEKSRREYAQAQENYKIKQRQNVEKMREKAAGLRKIENEHQAMVEVMQMFIITAPEPGMVIYSKGWDGKPIKQGSQINMWEPTVATLPDLTRMISKTYVNEVDVRKVRAGQKVDVGLDAYPDKKLTGSVTRVANVGEQRPNSDAKVFEVVVEINGTDAALRPSMTTSNRIIAHQVDSALYIPLECLHSEADTITYVFRKEGIKTVKQEVMIGETNASDVVIREGLTENDRIYLSIPGGMEHSHVSLLKTMDGKRHKKQNTGESDTLPLSPTASNR